MGTLERNLRLYAWYQPLARTYFWAPVFFLFFSARFPIERVLLLQSLYYVAVVALEVPSGYLSDRVSRTVTLRLSAAAAVLAYGGFWLGGSSYALFCAAQVAMAISFSFASGTDVAFHYDTLAGLGRESEFGGREARISSRALFASSVSAVLGGAVAMVELRAAYGLSLLVALVQLGVVLAMRQPPREPGARRHGFVRQLGICLTYLRLPALRWLFAFVVLQTTLEHVPYEFVQPYLAAVLGESATQVRDTPLAAGFVTAAIAFVAAFAAARSVGLRDRFGLTRVLLGVTSLQTLIIGLMAAVFHAIVIPFVMLRSCYPAVARVLVAAAVTPRVPQSQRATYLSLHSLSGRLGYACVLYGMSELAAGAANDPGTISAMLRWCFALAVAGVCALALTAGALRRDESTK